MEVFASSNFIGQAGLATGALCNEPDLAAGDVEVVASGTASVTATGIECGWVGGCARGVATAAARLSQAGQQTTAPQHAGPAHAGPAHAGPAHAGPPHAGPTTCRPHHMPAPPHAGPTTCRPHHMPAQYAAHRRSRQTQHADPARTEDPTTYHGHPERVGRHGILGPPSSPSVPTASIHPENAYSGTASLAPPPSLSSPTQLSACTYSP
eukprot:365241-Chlamydomonas_euryale.AAC.22